MDQNNKMIDTINLYKGLYSKHGFSPEALGCTKGKQFLRFHQLTHKFDLNNSSILDVGCGFGDFTRYLNASSVKNYNYVGVDIMMEFIELAKANNGNENAEFILGDFQEIDFKKRFDFVIASGIFNSKISGVDNYDFIWSSMVKMYELCDKAISIDFLSDRVDFSHEFNFNSSPEKILTFAYNLSRNVILNNSYFPFEFSVTIFKDDSFNPETTTFRDYESLLNELKM